MISGDAYKQIDAAADHEEAPGGRARLTLGDQKWQGELIMNFVIAVFAGIALVFAVLVLLYRRFLAPLVNLGSLLLAPLGAVIALHIAGQPLSLPVFIGLLMLFGIVAKNSILLVDFAVEMMDHGMTKDEAIVEAGHKRAQPIVMTTVAMVAGMIPIALQPDRRRQLARADGDHGDRRPAHVDLPDLAAGPGLFQHRDRHRDLDRPQARSPSQRHGARSAGPGARTASHARSLSATGGVNPTGRFGY